MNAETASIRFWEKQADSYSKKPIANLPVYHRKLEHTRARLQPHHTVLDFGCGTGSLALELAPLVAEVHGVDSSGEMHRIAKGKATDQKVENVTFHHGGLDVLASFESESFDTICAYNILHLVPERQQACHELFRLLKPGGSLIVSTPCIGESRAPWFLIIKVMQWLGKAPYVEIIRKAEVEGELVEAGFVDFQRPDVGAPPRTSFCLARKPK